ncbi:hypothetical protein RO3G_03900 [Rhizopus delemar RA 99-880]|uniref:Uncharacterized protein n=1 Tax=Rhizopus delemar (strain RA 99-880 / ATCC MYA-4621 / FGSC 9543 / NRRL 43880) TaxID=246409 RepID=I1BSL5_RHIO9|nr:hypothetical protein RO3G_03900 [Rhizopus delemar RA 99-880]|eukprot:EIE79195.1 hypothetical protein RO3G_03900 [Rhizopus delemar RA 99-880]
MLVKVKSAPFEGGKLSIDSARRGVNRRYHKDRLSGETSIFQKSGYFEVGIGDIADDGRDCCIRDNRNSLDEEEEGWSDDNKGRIHPKC